MIDIYYIVLVIPALLFAMWAQTKVSTTSSKYSKVLNSAGVTGAQAARRILDENGLYNVAIERVSGNLTDHYDPKSNVIRLSDVVYDKSTVTAIGVAAHEAGHAVQYAEGYGPIKLRTAILPICSIGSNIAMPLVVLGFVLGALNLVTLGIIAFAVAAFFQVVTLPVEFNASSRALSALDNSPYFSDDEIKGVKKVLTAAAMTYVAAMATALANLLRLILIVNRHRD